jgi:PAS domain S-box-containing protein
MMKTDQALLRISKKYQRASIETEPNRVYCKKADGTLCPVMVFGSPILRNDEIVGRRGIIVDISERKNRS